MVSTFAQRTRLLEDEVGDGDLTMGIKVQQPYAAAEHNRAYYKHPRGGMAYYFEVPFIGYREDFILRLANAAITKDGSDLRSEARSIADDMADITKRYAPVESGLLRDSTDAYVRDAGIEIYYREGLAPYNTSKE